MTLEPWHFITLMLTLIGSFWAIARFLFVQIDKRLTERFTTLEKELPRLEREFMNFKADIPLYYVRREDYVRNQTVIEAKLDALALKLEHSHKGDTK